GAGFHPSVRDLVAALSERLPGRHVAGAIVANRDHNRVSEWRGLLNSQSQFHKYFARQTNNRSICIQSKHLHFHRTGWASSSEIERLYGNHFDEEIGVGIAELIHF